MEVLTAWIGAVAQHGRIGCSLRPDVKSPWISVEDIAKMATTEFMKPTGEHRVIHQLGVDLTMPEIAAVISQEIDRSVEYRFVDNTRMDLQAEFVKRFGTLERWVDDMQSLYALNDGRVRFGEARPTLPTTLESFVRNVWKQKYLSALNKEPAPETFYSWSSGL